MCSHCQLWKIADDTLWRVTNTPTPRRISCRYIDNPNSLPTQNNSMAKMESPRCGNIYLTAERAHLRHGFSINVSSISAKERSHSTKIHICKTDNLKKETQIRKRLIFQIHTCTGYINSDEVSRCPPKLVTSQIQ